MHMDETPEELELRIERASDHRERAEAMAALAWKVKYALPRRAIELGEEARLLAEREGLADVIPRCLLPQAMGQLHLGAGDDAERSAMRALDLYRAGSDVKGERAACNVLGSVHLQQGKLSRALDCYLSAREAHLSIAGDEDPGILSNIGAVQLALGDCESAIDSFLKAREATGDDAPSDLRAATHSNLGDAYAAMGLHGQALECYRDCLEVCRRNNMKQALAITLSHMADSCVELGRQGQARICSMEAMDIYRELGDPLGRAVCLENLGGSACAAGDHRSAVDFFGEALEIYAGSGSSRGRVSASLGLAESLEGLGKTARALESLRGALQLAPEIRGERLRARIHKSLAGFLERRGEAGEALKHLREYQRIYERMLGESAASKLSSLRLLHRAETVRREQELRRLREQRPAERPWGSEDGRRALLAEFAGAVAGQFNDLLTAIVATAELGLREDADSKENRRALQSVLESARRGEEMTGRLMAFGGRKPLARTTVDLEELVRESVAELAPAICAEAEVSVVRNGYVPEVSADPEVLREVVADLLAFACRGEAAGRTVELALRGTGTAGPSASESRGRLAALTVFDDGPAPDLEAGHSFPIAAAPGGRAGRRVSLELAEAHGAVLQHGGWMTMARDRSGTTVSVYLPEGGQRPSVPEPPPRPIGPGGSPGTILVVEDNDQVLELVSDVLRRAGYRVLACGMAAEAAALLADDAATVDLVFTDIMLPDGSGIELARTVAEHHPDVKVVVGSGYTPSFDAREFVEKMSIPFLAKPYRISDITEVMERLLRPGPRGSGAEG